MNAPKPIEITNTDYKDYLSIQYAFTNVCNYKCNYCWPDSHAGTSRWPDYDKILKNFDHLITVYKGTGKKLVRLHLLGGEPTLWPKLGDFVKAIKEKHPDLRITMASNGSRTLRWWEEHAQYFNDIHISVHHEFCDLDHIKRVLDCIYGKGSVMVSANVLMDPLAKDRCQEIANDLLEYPAEWLVKVWAVLDTNTRNLRNEYNQEELDYLENKVKRKPPESYILKMQELGNIEKKTSAIIRYDDGTSIPYKTFALLKDKSNSFLGWDCNLGKDRITIQNNGRLQGTCGELKVFKDETFYIHDDDFVERFNANLIQTVKCSMAFCGCSADIRLPKKKRV